jgi:hypothetical protein
MIIKSKGRRVVRNIARMRKMKNAFENSVQNLKGWEIKIYLKGTGSKGWTKFIQFERETSHYPL